MEPTVVEESSVVIDFRDKDVISKIYTALDSFKRMLRNERFRRVTHIQLEGCFNLLNQYISADNLDEIKKLNPNNIQSALQFVDEIFENVLTTADNHEFIREVIKLLGQDLEEVRTRLG